MTIDEIILNDDAIPAYVKVVHFIRLHGENGVWRGERGELEKALNKSKPTVYQAIVKLKEMNLLDKRSSPVHLEMLY